MASNETEMNIPVDTTTAQNGLQKLNKSTEEALQNTLGLVKTTEDCIAQIQKLGNSWQKTQNGLTQYSASVDGVSKALSFAQTGLSAFQLVVGVATSKIELATAAQHLWNIALNANVIGVVVTAIGAMVGALTLLASKQTEQEAQMAALAEKAQEQRTTWDELKNSQAEQIQASTAEIDHIKALWQEMQMLVDANGKVIGEKDRLKFITEEINGLLPNTIVWLDDETLSYQNGAQAVSDLLEKKRALAIHEAQEPAYKEAITQRQETLNRMAERKLEIDQKQLEVNALLAEFEAVKGTAAAEGAGIRLSIAERELSALQAQQAEDEALYSSFLSFINQYEQQGEAIASNNLEAIRQINNGITQSFEYTQDGVKRSLNEQIALAQAQVDEIQRMLNEGVEGVSEDMLAQAQALLNALKEQAFQGGLAITHGMERGLVTGAKSLNKIASSVAMGAVVSQKKAIESNSPSKLTAREIGVPLIQGILVGMEQEAPHLFQATVAISKEALERAKAEAGSYREVGSLYLTYLKEGVEANTAQAITTFTNLLNESVEALAAKNPDAKSALQQEGRAAINAYTKAIQAGGQESIAAVKELMDEVSQTAQNKYDEISRKQQNLSSKLAGYGSLFQVKDQEVAIADVQQYTATISQYMDLLQQLKASGAGEAVLAEVSRLGIDEGLLVAQELLAMQEENPADFAALVADWEENRRKTEELAGNFYAAEMQQLEESFQEDLNHVLAKVPSLVEGSGRAAMEGFIKGWQSKDEDLTRVIEQTIDRAIRAMQEGWEEHSPSKVTERIGANVGLGFIQGYDTTMSALGRRMAQTVAQESSTFQQQAQAIAANQGGLWARNTTTREIHNNTVQEKVVGLRFSGDLAAVARLLKPELDAESSRYGKRLAQG